MLEAKHAESNSDRVAGNGCVLDDSNMRVRDQFLGEYWVAGVATDEAVDGGYYLLDGLFEYAGTKQYTTVLGASRTVHVIRPVPLTIDERVFLGL